MNFLIKPENYPYWGILLCIGMITLSLGQSVQAGPNTMIQLLKVLHDKGTIDKETFDLLEASALSDEDESIQKTSELEKTVNKVKKNSLSASLSGGHLKFKTDDDAFTLQLGGRIMIDGAWYDSDKQGLGNGTEIRRARIFTKGRFWNDWHFKAQYDFSGHSTGIKDAYLAYTGLSHYLPVPLTIKVGNFFEPFGLEILTSSKFITFMERGLPNIFVPGRNMGVGLSTHGKNWTSSIGAYGSGVDNENQNGHESYGFAGRGTYAPLYEKTLSLHLGAAFEYRELKGQNIRVRERPESHISNINFIDTDFFEGNNSIKWGAELATVQGPFSLQAEYFNVSYDTATTSHLNLNGWYAFASWFVTGESRNYIPSLGKFGRVKPIHKMGQGGYGAWELAIRYSDIDLNDDNITGGRENNLTLGINWYVTPSIRFMANYVFVDSKRNEISDDPQIFQLRSQIDF